MVHATQKGFTLIELMISLTLGLLVGAAAIQMLVISQRTLLSQQASSSIQDNAIFGLQTMSRSVYIAGVGSKVRTATPNAPQGAIVITTDTKTNNVDPNITNLEAIRLKDGSGIIPKSVVSCSEGIKQNPDGTLCDNVVSAGSTGWQGLSNLTGLKSDQLVIQYSAPMDTYDCEGVAVKKGIMVIERYFLREDDNKQPNEPTPLALACDAGHYDISNEADYLANKIALISTAAGGNDFPELKGEIIINRVDHFAFQVGVTTNTNNLMNLAEDPDSNQIAYYSLADYLKLAAPLPRISHIRFGIVARSMLPAKSGRKDSEQRFNLLDKTDLKLSTTSSAPYMRKVYSSTILLRSARS